MAFLGGKLRIDSTFLTTEKSAAKMKSIFPICLFGIDLLPFLRQSRIAWETNVDEVKIVKSRDI